MSVLQSQNLDSEGLRNLDKFLGSAKRAAELVSEALLRPQKRFEHTNF